LPGCNFEQAVLSLRVADFGAGVVVDPRKLQETAICVDKLRRAATYRDSAVAFAKKYAGFDANLQLARVVDSLCCALD
jgi:hypothetical protein